MGSSACLCVFSLTKDADQLPFRGGLKKEEKRECEETKSSTGTEVVGKEMWQGVDAQPRSAGASYEAAIP